MFVGVQEAVEGEGWMVRATDKYYYIFGRKGCVQRNLYVNCVSQL